ncbi:chemotaxis protein [bacterium]|nr:chemotaxis protein [candidate division CSSED10-310 bacterium]
MRERLNMHLIVPVIITFLCAGFMWIPTTGAQELKGVDAVAKKIADDCKLEVEEQMNLLMTSGRLTLGQLFDTFYIPVQDTNPQKFHTAYDTIFDEVLQKILDKYLVKDERVTFVVVTDKNGYVPTHNTKYSQPLTGNQDVDILNNRTKRMFNDRTGLAASRNTEPFLLQKYARDTGEKMADISVPIMIRNQHWGAVRVGYKL